jgi:8-amino-7-oxononanoate synthase
MMAETPCLGIRFVVIESLYGMDGDFARLEACARLCRAMNAVLVVDEAHAVGIYGERGSGLLETLDDFDGVTISINTAGKALGVAGAFVAGSDWVIEYLVQRARPFVFSTAPPPALAHALRASLLSIQQEPERRTRLLARSAHLRKRLQAAGVQVSDEVSQIVPVVIGDNERAVLVADALQRDGFDVRAIRPPTVPPRTARLRVSMNASITEATIDRFVDRLTACLSACGGPQAPARPIGRL